MLNKLQCTVGSLQFIIDTSLVVDGYKILDFVFYFHSVIGEHNSKNNNNIDGNVVVYTALPAVWLPDGQTEQ